MNVTLHYIQYSVFLFLCWQELNEQEPLLQYKQYCKKYLSEQAFLL